LRMDTGFLAISVLLSTRERRTVAVSSVAATRFGNY
jgi:hypothetical protein